MAQGFLPFQYEIEKREGGMTGLAGLPVYLEFAQVMGFGRIISQQRAGTSMGIRAGLTNRW